MKKCFSLLLVMAMAVMLMAVPVFAAVVPDPSVESAIAAAAAKAAASDEIVPESSVDPTEEASGEPSGEFDVASFFEALNPGAGEIINVLSSAIVFPLCFISISLWFFRVYGLAAKKDTGKDNNIWLKIYRVLRKIHIPVGAATIIIGLYHTIFASINHGWSLNWGSAAMIFYLLGFVTWLFRKKLKHRWLVLHQFTTLIATVCMMLHASPYLKLVFTIIAPIMLQKAVGL